jgi:hypothetical protein
VLVVGRLGAGAGVGGHGHMPWANDTEVLKQLQSL